MASAPFLPKLVSWDPAAQLFGTEQNSSWPRGSIGPLPRGGDRSGLQTAGLHSWDSAERGRGGVQAAGRPHSEQRSSDAQHCVP